MSNINKYEMVEVFGGKADPKWLETQLQQKEDKLLELENEKQSMTDFMERHLLLGAYKEWKERDKASEYCDLTSRIGDLNQDLCEMLKKKEKLEKDRAELRFVSKEQEK